MLKEAIVLAGGLGTRLKSVTQDIPKPMIDINNKPFLQYILDYLSNFQLKKIILSVGYQYETILNYFNKQYNNLTLFYSIEDKLLGTGGAIKKSLSFIEGEKVLILNGDTFFKIDFFKFLDFHNKKNADLSIALKYMKNFDRYGTVEIDKENRITGFQEKGFKKYGLINGGSYLIKTDILQDIKLPEKFSFEQDFLEKYYKKLKCYGIIFNEYFIDIGIPSDYLIAKKELPMIIK